MAVDADLAVTAWLTRHHADLAGKAVETPEQFYDTAATLAADCLTAVGRTLAAAVQTRARVKADFLGELRWDGTSRVVALTPSGLLREHFQSGRASFRNGGMTKV